MKGKISVVINVVDWEVELLPEALSSIRNLADEIILVDMTSSDEIRIPARKYNAKIFKHKRVMYVEPARNFGISKARGEWILILDPDEKIPQKLAIKLKKIAAKHTSDYYRLPRKNIVFGKWIKHSRWWPDYNIRFFRKDFVTWSEVIHAVPVTTGKGADLMPSGENAIVHHHYDSIDEYLEKLTRYTTQHSKLVIKDGYKFKWQDLVIKPSNEFLSRYFQGEGYKDGVHGMALAGLQAFSEFVLYLKVWQAEKFKKITPSASRVAGQMKESQKDFHYWKADALIREGAGIIARIKRKFRLS